MSGRIINAVLDANFTRAETLVLIAIANHTNDQGKGCFANEAKLAYHTKYNHLTTLRRILDALVERGVVIERHDPRLGDVWDINLEKLKSRSFMLWKREEWPKLVTKRLSDSNLEPDTSSRESYLESNIDSRESSLENTNEPCGEKRRNMDENAAKNAAEDTPDSLVVACGEKRRTILILRPKEKNIRPRVYARGQKSTTGQEQLDMAQRYDDSDLDYVSEEEENDPKGKNSPETDLQRKIAALCDSKYLSRDMKGKLRSTVTAAAKKGLPTPHPSPEDEWKAHPEWFAEYVDLCAQRIREESLRPPSRVALINSIRAYGRHKTGWLAFKAAKELAKRVEEAQRPPAVRRHFSSDPTAPIWRQ